MMKSFFKYCLIIIILWILRGFFSFIFIGYSLIDIDRFFPPQEYRLSYYCHSILAMAPIFLSEALSALAAAAASVFLLKEKQYIIVSVLILSGTAPFTFQHVYNEENSIAILKFCLSLVITFSFTILGIALVAKKRKINNIQV